MQEGSDTKTESLFFFQLLKRNNVRCSVIGLSAEMHLCRTLARETNGKRFDFLALQGLLLPRWDRFSRGLTRPLCMRDLHERGLQAIWESASRSDL